MKTSSVGIQSFISLSFLEWNKIPRVPANPTVSHFCLSVMLQDRDGGKAWFLPLFQLKEDLLGPSLFRVFHHTCAT